MEKLIQYQIMCEVEKQEQQQQHLQQQLRIRTAQCCCGQFKLTIQGDPLRISMCHCFSCQRRTGSVFGVQARFTPDQIVSIEGDYKVYNRQAEGVVTSKFCANCGSTVTYSISTMPDIVAVAVGCLEDPNIGRPVYSVYETRKHSWVEIPKDIEHYD